MAFASATFSSRSPRRGSTSRTRSPIFRNAPSNDVTQLAKSSRKLLPLPFNLIVSQNRATEARPRFVNRGKRANRRFDSATTQMNSARNVGDQSTLLFSSGSDFGFQVCRAVDSGGARQSGFAGGAGSWCTATTVGTCGLFGMSSHTSSIAAFFSGRGRRPQFHHRHAIHNASRTRAAPSKRAARALSKIRRRHSTRTHRRDPRTSRVFRRRAHHDPAINPRAGVSRTRTYRRDRSSE